MWPYGEIASIIAARSRGSIAASIVVIETGEVALRRGTGY